MKKIIRNNVIGFVLAGLLCGAVTVISASQNLSSSSVEYKNSKSVSTALNELYAKESQLPKKYKIGDKVKVKNEDYYVIADSPRSQDYVTLLKAEPLTVEEINTYGGVGTENNHVNKNTSTTPGTAYNRNGYGGMAYYSSLTCGSDNGGSLISTGCTNNYKDSDIKYVVDVWTEDKFISTDLKEIDGYKSRLISKDELVNDLGCTSNNCSKSLYSWTFSSKYGYWTMTPSSSKLFSFFTEYTGDLRNGYIFENYSSVVRPVINIYKNKI